MSRVLRVALVGDRDDGHVAHRAIPRALELASHGEGVTLAPEWVATETLARPAERLAGFDGVWCVPASPYRSTEGALGAIRHAREAGVPFLGTCGGFQHAVLECARTLWGMPAATHAEEDPTAPQPVVAPLACALVEVGGDLTFGSGSRLATAYGVERAHEEYHCSYGLATRTLPHLEKGPLRATAWSSDGDVRGVELDGHPFFVATLFQPERAALRGDVPPVVAAFVHAAAQHAVARATGRPIERSGIASIPTASQVVSPA